MWAQGSQLASELWQEPPRAWGADLGGRQSLAQPGTPALLGGESSWVPPKRGYAETVVAVRKVLSPSGRRKNERGAWFSANCAWAQGTVLFKGTFLGRGDYRQGSL